MTDTAHRKTARNGGEPESPGRREPFLGLSPAQVLGGALAATTAAVVSSYLGVAGTLIGAALASIVSTVGSALYTQSMRRANGLAQAGVRRLGPRSSGGSSVAPNPGNASSAASPRRSLTEPDGAGGSLRGVVTRVNRRVWIGAVAVFLMAIAAITGFELVTGKPVSAAVDGGTSHGTTIGSVVAPGSATSSDLSDDSVSEPTPTSRSTQGAGSTEGTGGVATDSTEATQAPQESDPTRAPQGSDVTQKPTGQSEATPAPTATNGVSNDGQGGSRDQGVQGDQNRSNQQDPAPAGAADKPAPAATP